MSRKKGNQIMTFGQLIEYNTRKNMKNHVQNVEEKLVPDSFLKNQNLPYLWINSLDFHTVCFYYMLKSRTTKHIETKVLTTCFYFT